MRLLLGRLCPRGGQRAWGPKTVPDPKRRHGLVGGPLPAVVGPVCGREVEWMRRLAGEEEPVLERPGQPCPGLGLARQGAAIRPPMDANRLHDVAASGRTAAATSLPNRAANSADT
jgi:hypothetical protein